MVEVLSQVNIQTKFAQLRLEHFLVYLPKNGWKGALGVRRDRMRFELPDDPDPYVLILPSSNQIPYSQKLLQNAIYVLSGVEDRQPIEIIRDLLATDPGAIPASRIPPVVRLRFQNLHSAQITLRIASRLTEYVLMPGEAIEIDPISSSGEFPVEIGVGDTLILVGGPAHG